MRFATSFLCGIALSIVLAGSANASIQVTSVNRGVTVDGVTSSNSTTGLYSVTRSNTNDFGSAHASITSNIVGHTLTASGSASVFAVSGLEEFSPIERATVFFDITFAVDQPYDFSLTGSLGGSSDSEHYVTRLSLTGPGINLVYDATDSYAFFNQFGTLQDGDYVFSMYASPRVLGGLDGGWADTGFYGELVLIPLGPSGGIEAPVPEPTSLFVWSAVGLAVAGLSRRGLINL